MCTNRGLPLLQPLRKALPPRYQLLSSCTFGYKLHRCTRNNSSTMPNVPFTFRGLIAPVLTPFQKNSARTLDLAIIPEYAQFLANRGIKGVLVNGTSGEGPSLSVDERKAVAEAWVRAVRDTRQHLMLQVGGAPLPDVVALTKHAASIGVDSLLCLPELYFKPATPERLIEYLQIVGQTAPSIPLLYYHVPMFSSVNISMPSFLQSIGDKIPSFVGIKFTSTNLEEAILAHRVNNNQYAIFLGNDQIMAGAFAMGMDSAIATTLNMVPELGIELLTASVADKTEKAREIQGELSKVVGAISKYGNWVETMKVAMGLLTPIDVGPTRAPLGSLSEDSIKSMKEGLQALGYKLQNI